MANVNELPGTDYITVEYVRTLTTLEDKKVVIVGPGEVKKFEPRTGNDGKTIPEKTVIQIPVQTNKRLGHKTYVLTLNRKMALSLANDFGSEDTSGWVGGIIKLDVKEGTFASVHVTVIEAPKHK